MTETAGFTRHENGRCADGCDVCKKQKEKLVERNQKTLTVYKELYKTAESINSELPEVTPRIESGKERGLETLTLTIVIN